MPKTPEDIVKYLIPNNSAFPARLADIAKPDAISALLDAQQHSTGAKANAVAFLLIVLDQNTDANRQRLFDALRSCKTDPDNCDEDVVQYLAYLFEHGDKLVLNPLFDAVQFDDDGLAETLGDTLGDLAITDSRAFLTALSQRPADQKKDICKHLAEADGSGLPVDTAEQLQTSFAQLSREVGPVASTAMMCLTQLKTFGSK